MFLSLVAGKVRQSLIAVLLFSPVFSQAQYYYQDIYSTQQVNEKQAEYKKLHVKKVEITSLDAAMQKDDAFFIRKEMKDDYRTVISTTRSNVDGNSGDISVFDQSGKIISSTDSSQNGVSKTSYFYDPHGKLTRLLVESTSPNEVDIFSYSESHNYYYDQKGFLTKMVLVREKTDSAVTFFTCDDKGNVIAEKQTGGPVPAQTFYYKYDDDGKLTEIDRINPKNAEPVPEQLFQYGTAGQEIAMTTYSPGSTAFNTWRYSYDANGLRIEERCYQQGQNLLGAVKYDYSF